MKIDKNKKNNKDENELKFGTYFYVLQITGTILPILFGLAIIYFKSSFIWIGEPIHAAYALFFIGVFNTLFTIVYVIYKRHFLFVFLRYVYASFFLYLIYISGGVNSSLIFLLFIPLMTSVVYLDVKETKRTSIFINVVLLLMIFRHGGDEITYSLIVKHITQMVLLVLISYYTYRVVIETLRQKYEKEEAAKRLDEVLKLDHLKNDFLSVAQHQLRTPLSGVKWVLETLKSDTTLTSDTLSIISSGLDRINDSLGIINKMLKTIEEKEGTLNVVKKETDIAELIRTILKELNFMIMKKGTRLALNMPSRLIAMVDKDKMKAAINNIIDNAIKYSPNASVTITLTDGNGFVNLIVKDTGIGIMEEDLPYVFDRLRRGKNAVLIEPDESGVGLYTSKKIIELHGGTIKIDSTLNKGTTVTVAIPRN